MIRTTCIALVILAGSGCARTLSHVSGRVTYNGQPVEQGTITFLPADGKGSAAFAQIEAGVYSLDQVAPGPKVVEITSTRDIAFPRSSEEMAHQFAEAKAKGKAVAAERADLIPRYAPGNNRRVDVQPGRQEIDFSLEKPRRK